MSAAPGVFAPLRLATFRWLALGQIFSLLGDQMYLVALPWLALQRTNSGWALGAVLAAAAVPRALFILVGGALVDRFTPRRVMIASSMVSAAITTLLVVLLGSNTLEVWHLFMVAVCLGTSDAVYYPAASSIVPSVVERASLNSANAITSLITQTASFVGPGLAGLLVAQSPAAALIASVVCSLCSVAALLLLRVRAPRTSAYAVAFSVGAVLTEAGLGLRLVWRNAAMRGMLILLAALNLALIGPYMVGGGLLADERFGGASAFGALLSAFGAGGIIGTIAAASLGTVRRLGWLMLVVGVTLGLGTVAIAFAPTLWVALAVAVVMGLALGLEEVQLLTWFQQSAPAEMRGRIMGVVSFAAVGLEPISHMAAGALGTGGAAIPFLVGGLTTLGVMIVLACSATMRGITVEPRNQQEEKDETTVASTAT